MGKPESMPNNLTKKAIKVFLNFFRINSDNQSFKGG